MTKRARFILLAVSVVLLVTAFALVRSITIRLTIPDETVAATGNAASMIAVVIAAIAALLLLAWLISRIRIPARAAAAPAWDVDEPPPAPASLPARRETQRREPREISYGVRKILGALALGLIVFASTYVTFGRAEVAAAMTAILVVCAFSAYDQMDASLDNILGVVLVLFIAVALTLLVVVVGNTLAAAVGANPPAWLIWAWAISIPCAIGIHGLICNDGMPHIRADIHLPTHKRSIVAVGIALALVGIALAVTQ